MGYNIIIDMTEIQPRRKVRRSVYSSSITTVNRGYDSVILEGISKGTISYYLVVDQHDWFIRTRKLSRSDYAILRCCKFLDYSRMTKTFTIRDPLVVGYLAKKGAKPIVVRNTGSSITVPSTIMRKA